MDRNPVPDLVALDRPTVVTEDVAPIRQVTISPRGGYILVTRAQAANRYTTELWSRTGRNLQTFPAPPLTAALTPTIQLDDREQTMIIGTAVRLERWSLHETTVTHDQTIILPDDARQAILSPDGQRIALILEHQGIAVWEAGTTHALSGTAGLGVLADVQWSPDGQAVLVGGVNGAVQIWTMAWRQEVAFQTAAPLQTIRWSPDQQQVLTMGAMPQIWTRAGVEQATIQERWMADLSPTDEGAAVEFAPSPDGQWIAWIQGGPMDFSVSITDQTGQPHQVMPITIWEESPQIRWDRDSQRVELVHVSTDGSLVMEWPVGRQALLDQVACTVTRSLTPEEQAALQVTPVASAQQAACPLAPEGK